MAAPFGYFHWSPGASLVQKLRRFWWFYLVLELHREGSAPAACTAYCLEHFPYFPQQMAFFQTVSNVIVCLKTEFLETILYEKKILSGKFFRISGNFSRAHETFPVHLQYLYVLESCFLKKFCFLEILLSSWKILQRKLNFSRLSKILTCMFENCFSRAMTWHENFPDFLPMFPEQMKFF